MKDVVSFETAKRLKEAGFPQPEFSQWQPWFTKWGRLLYNDLDEEEFCFAPSATDILKELGRYYSLWYEKPIWYCTEDLMPTKLASWKHKNPAEACAAAYLSIHEKTTEQ